MPKKKISLVYFKMTIDRVFAGFASSSDGMSICGVLTGVNGVLPENRDHAQKMLDELSDDENLYKILFLGSRIEAEISFKKNDVRLTVHDVPQNFSIGFSNYFNSLGKVQKSALVNTLCVDRSVIYQWNSGLTIPKYDKMLLMLQYGVPYQSFFQGTFNGDKWLDLLFNDWSTKVKVIGVEAPPDVESISEYEKQRQQK